MSGNETGMQSRLVSGRYELAHELGRGGMGTVWLAEDRLVGRQVAVKELRPPQGLDQTDREVYGRRALQEARSAARVHHPGAVALYDVLQASGGDDAVYLIMELVEGPTLAEEIERHGALPEATVADYGLQLLAVLEAAHALGVVHRDIKPGNIIIAPGGQAKLTDFGIAHTVGDTRLTRSGVLGTHAYLAPELFETGAPITPAADLWSLGATLYHAAEGTGPFDRGTTGAILRAILIDDLPIPRCGPPLVTAITGMLCRDPARRASVSQFRPHLQAALQSPAVPASQAGPAADALAGETGPAPANTRAPQPSGTPAAERSARWERAETSLSPSRPTPPRHRTTSLRRTKGTAVFSNTNWYLAILFTLLFGCVMIAVWVVPQTGGMGSGGLVAFLAVECLYLIPASPVFVLATRRWCTLAMDAQGMITFRGPLHLAKVPVPWTQITRIAPLTSGVRTYLYVWGEGITSDPTLPLRLCPLKPPTFASDAIRDAIVSRCPTVNIEPL